MTVLLIDNDVVFRDQLTDALDRFGMALLWRARILGLLDAVANNEPEAVILSADLPGADPLELIRAIRQQNSWADLPVFLVGSSMDRADELRAYAEGADAVVARDTATPELAARLLGLSSIKNRRWRGTTKSIADAALALCAAPKSPEPAAPVAPTAGAPAAQPGMPHPVHTAPPHAAPMPYGYPAPGNPYGYYPVPAYGHPTPGYGPRPGEQMPPQGVPMPPQGMPAYPPHGQPMPPHGQPMPPQGMPAYPPHTMPGAPQPQHTAAHAPPNGQFVPPTGVATPPPSTTGLGPEYRGEPPPLPGQTGIGAPVSPASVPDVIVVEDDPSLLEMLRYALTNRGFTTLSFSNGLDALRALREMETAGRQPVVLLDVDLPGLDGFRILHELSGARPGVFQVILCTVHSSEATQVLGIQSGALDYLVKPLRMPIVLAKVERLLGRGGVSSAAGSR
jgi:DNA-binding response OmpR family regulator